MNLSKPLVTPEELQCLLGWPLPANEPAANAQPQPSAASPAAGQAQVGGLALAA